MSSPFVANGRNGYGVTEAPAGAAAVVTTTADQAELYDYDSEPGLYGMVQAAHSPIRLYQARLIVDKDRFKTGEMAIDKRAETKMQDVSVPVQNEQMGNPNVVKR
ncbi:MAG: DUF2382 domain-containing protein [Cyanobacteria bacterium P01_D01_bin.44]